MTAKPEFKTDIDNTLKARFADGLKDHYHQAIAREMIRSRPTLSYVVYKAEVLKTLGPNIKPLSITVNKLDTSDIESPPKKRKRDSELDQKINTALEENRKLSERLSAFDPKTIVILSSTLFKVIHRSKNLTLLVQNLTNHLSSMVNPRNLSWCQVLMDR